MASLARVKNDSAVRVTARPALTRTLTYIVLLVGSVVLLFPFAWMVSTSLKPDDQLYLFPPKWIPEPIQWANYAVAWTSVPFATYTRNTILITTLNIIGNMLGSSLAAFSFARLRFPGRQQLFLIMLSTMMVPYWVTVVPTFILFRLLGWTNTYAPLIVPGFFAVPYYTFLLRQYFMGISTELEDAARIDGASTFRIYWQIVMPLAKPALASVAIFSFVAHWNDLINPLIYITDQSKYTIALGLAGFRSGYRIEFSHMMAASTMAVLPVIIIYFFAQRLFIQGILLSASKG
ncbi:MAG: carbohydrate ABC transporter permease [Anaerolineales bacterium]|nr:carbohydrate ABC transporter permease [Anaerolineales bacterium]